MMKKSSHPSTVNPLIFQGGSFPSHQTTRVIRNFISLSAINFLLCFCAKTALAQNGSNDLQGSWQIDKVDFKEYNQSSGLLISESTVHFDNGDAKEPLPPLTPTLNELSFTSDSVYIFTSRKQFAAGTYQYDHILLTIEAQVSKSDKEENFHIPQFETTWLSAEMITLSSNIYTTASDGTQVIVNIVQYIRKLSPDHTLILRKYTY